MGTSANAAFAHRALNLNGLVETNKKLSLDRICMVVASF